MRLQRIKKIISLTSALDEKSLKYYETLYSSESYKIMNKMIEELLASETKKINIVYPINYNKLLLLYQDNF